MELKEELKMYDGIRPLGWVSVYKDGKLCFSKHNMIVDTGREFVKNIMFSKFPKKSSSVIPEFQEVDVSSNLYFNRVAFGTSSEPAIPSNSSISEISAPGASSIYLSCSDGGNTITPTFTDIENSEHSITISLTANASDLGVSSGTTAVFRELGIYLHHNITNELADVNRENVNADILYSRIVFDPIFVDETSSLAITYTLYF